VVQPFLVLAFVLFRAVRYGSADHDPRATWVSWASGAPMPSAAAGSLVGPIATAWCSCPAAGTATAGAGRWQPSGKRTAPPRARCRWPSVVLSAAGSRCSGGSLEDTVGCAVARAAPGSPPGQPPGGGGGRSGRGDGCSCNGHRVRGGRLANSRFILYPSWSVTGGSASLHAVFIRW